MAMLDSEAREQLREVRQRIAQAVESLGAYADADENTDNATMIAGTLRQALAITIAQQEMIDALWHVVEGLDDAAHDHHIEYRAMRRPGSYGGLGTRYR